jgi:hypothetical protein
VAKAGLGRAVSLSAGLLVVGLFGLIYTGYQRDIRQARERVSTGSQIAQTPCGPIEYAVVITIRNPFTTVGSEFLFVD